MVDLVSGLQRKESYVRDGRSLILLVVLLRVQPTRRRLSKTKPMIVLVAISCFLKG